MKRIIRNAALFAILQVGVFLTPIAIYYYANYADVVVTEGTRFGLSIGDSKHATYQKLYGSLTALDRGFSRVFVSTVSDAQVAPILGVKPGDRVLTQTYFNDIGFPRFARDDTWTLYINGSMHNSLRLTFCDDRLCEIYRHKAVFEVP